MHEIQEICLACFRQHPVLSYDDCNYSSMVSGPHLAQHLLPTSSDTNFLPNRQKHLPTSSHPVKPVVPPSERAYKVPTRSSPCPLHSPGVCISNRSNTPCEARRPSVDLHVCLNAQTFPFFEVISAYLDAESCDERSSIHLMGLWLSPTSNAQVVHTDLLTGAI